LFTEVPRWIEFSEVRHAPSLGESKIAQFSSTLYIPSRVEEDRVFVPIAAIDYARRGVGPSEEGVALAVVEPVLEARRLVPDDCVDSVVVAAVYDGTLLTLFSCTLNLPLPHISYTYSPNNVEGEFSEVYIQHSA
jgi:hypothetical protein